MMQQQQRQKMITITKGVNPAKGKKGVTVFLNGEDVSHRCRAASVPEQPDVEGNGWVEVRWASDSTPERLNGRTMWREG